MVAAIKLARDDRRASRRFAMALDSFDESEAAAAASQGGDDRAYSLRAESAADKEQWTALLSQIVPEVGCLDLQQSVLSAKANLRTTSRTRRSPSTRAFSVADSIL